MANTVYHFTPTNVVNGVTAANATWGNAVQNQALDAISGLNPDLLTAFVLSGVTCTKDGTNANQLDIASGRAYVTQTDGTIALIVVATDNTHTTATPSTTYNLYLQPDGTWYWSTSNAPQTNSLYIASVTTDGSGNINVVTDQRTTATALLSGMSGHLNVPKIGAVNGQASVGAFGVPTIVAQALRVNVTATTQQTIITYAAPVTGFYRVSVYVNLNNGSAPGAMLLLTQFTDADVNAVRSVAMIAAQAVSVNSNQDSVAPLWDGTQLSGGFPPNFVYGFAPYLIYAKAATNINVLYRDPGGTPNDYVTAIIERMA